MAAADRSLKRLGVDTIDLYQTHWPNLAVPFASTLDGLRSLLDQGKIRAVGLSNSSRRQWDLAHAAFSPDKLVSFQQQYNLADRSVEITHLPICRATGLALIAYSPLLEGQITPNDERRFELEALAKVSGITIGQLVLAWLLRHPEAVVIPKATSPAHLEENIAAAAAVLDPDTADAIQRLYSPHLLEIAPDNIDVVDDANRNVYKTQQDALSNWAGMIPSPREMADEFLAGEAFKPIKVRRGTGTSKSYVLTEGRLRYWAWVIAYGDRKPIACILI